MGKITASGVDQAHKVVSGSFTATGQSGTATDPLSGEVVPASFQGNINLNLYWTAFTGTIQLERSFDGGTTWQAVSKDSAGSALSFSGVGTAFAYSAVAFEPESGVLYRWNCTSFTSGTANYRISL